MKIPIKNKAIYNVQNSEKAQFIDHNTYLEKCFEINGNEQVVLRNFRLKRNLKMETMCTFYLLIYLGNTTFEWKSLKTS